MSSDTKPSKQSTIHDAMPRYFKCRFFKGHILHLKILEAKDEVDIKNVFAKRYPSRHLLEAIEVNEV